MKAVNIYKLPLLVKNITEIDGINSPAHEGLLKYAVDLECAERTPVYASLKGEVVSVKDDSNLGGPDEKYWNDGNRIEIRHENDEYTAYEHLMCKGSVVVLGDVIETGKLIGYSGNTGYSDSPHLHFEVFHYVNGEQETMEFTFEDLNYLRQLWLRKNELLRYLGIIPNGLKKY